MHAYIHTYTQTYIYTYIYTYTHTYVHTHIHTYTYTYIHTYIWSSVENVPNITVERWWNFSDRQNRGNQTKTCPITTLFYKNPTRTLPCFSSVYHLNSDLNGLIKIMTFLFQKSQSFVEIRNQYFMHTDE